MTSSSAFSALSGAHVECVVPEALDTAAGGLYNVTVGITPACMSPAASAGSAACHTHGLDSDGLSWAAGAFAEASLPGCSCDEGAAPTITGATVSSNVTGTVVSVYGSFGPLLPDTVGECAFGIVNGTAAPAAAGSTTAVFASASKATCALPPSLGGDTPVAVTLAAWRSCGTVSAACQSSGTGAALGSWPALGYGLLTTPSCDCGPGTRPSVSFAEVTAERVRLFGTVPAFPDTTVWCVFVDKDADDTDSHAVAGTLHWRGSLAYVECEHPAALEGALEIEARIGAVRGCSAANTTLCLSAGAVSYETPACECGAATQPVLTGASVLGDRVILAGDFAVTPQTDAWCRFFQGPTLRAVERAVAVSEAAIECAVPAIEPGAAVEVQAWVHTECASYPSAGECLSESLAPVVLPSCECEPSRAPQIHNVTADASGTVLAVLGVFDAHRDSLAECIVSGDGVSETVPSVVVSGSLVECGYPAAAAALAGTLQVDVRVVRGCAFDPGSSACVSTESGEYTEFCASLGAGSCSECFAADVARRCGWCEATRTCVALSQDGMPPAGHACEQAHPKWYIDECPATVGPGCSSGTSMQRLFSPEGDFVGIRLA